MDSSNFTFTTHSHVDGGCGDIFWSAEPLWSFRNGKKFPPIEAYCGQNDDVSAVSLAQNIHGSLLEKL